MPSHTDTQPKKKENAPSWLKEWHVKGNSAADTLASAAASLHEVPKEQADKILKIYEDPYQIQKRIIEVTKMYPQRKHNKTIFEHVTDKRTYQDKIIDKLEQSQHDCIIHNNRLYCNRCNASIHIRAAHIEDFIKSSCLSTQYNYCFAVGHQHTHHSHRMVIYREIYMCTKCGSTGSRKLINFFRECMPPKTRGQQNIDTYAAGTAPAGYNNWSYKCVHLDENSAVNNVQTLVDRMREKYKNEYDQQNTHVYDADNDSAFDEDPEEMAQYVPEVCVSGSESESD